MLDTVTETLLQEALEYLKQSRSTLSAPHPLSTTPKAKRIVVWERGHITLSGQLSSISGEHRRLCAARCVTKLNHPDLDFSVAYPSSADFLVHVSDPQFCLDTLP